MHESENINGKNLIPKFQLISILRSGVVGGGGGGGHGGIATPDSEKLAQKREKSGKKRKNQEEKAKIRKALSLCPPPPPRQIGLATLLILHFQVMHDYVCFIAPIDYCVA